MATLLLPLAAAGAQAPGDERYVPSGIWPDRRDGAFYEGWFGPRLRAMGEPILWRPGDRERFRRRLRILVIPHYSRPWALRIDERGTGDAWVRRVQLDGPGAGRPRGVARQDRFRIERADLLALERGFRVADLRSFTPEDDREGWQGPEPTEPEDETVGDDMRAITICLHATQYVFELVDSAGYHMVTRSACDLPEALRRLLRSVEPLHWDY